MPPQPSTAGGNETDILLLVVYAVVGFPAAGLLVGSAVAFLMPQTSIRFIGQGALLGMGLAIVGAAVTGVVGAATDGLGGRVTNPVLLAVLILGLPATGALSPVVMLPLWRRCQRREPEHSA
ncbi:MAG: hypothetical protein OXE87_04830 [Chloroflexi bacterium]|nr:hypothetical protein [Chloroflexota bacterium]